MAKRAIFDKKNILILGGAGFIGSHLCDELLKDNKVICLDNFSSGDERNIDHLLSDPDFAFIKHDITQPIDLEKLPELQRFKIEFQGVQDIYNLACPMSPKDFSENKINTILSNSYGVINALELARKYEAKFMQFSSSVVYGPRREDKTKIKEEDLGVVDMLSERSAYDEGKRFAETIVKNYATVFQVDLKIVRLFRIYGPRMKLNDDQMIPDFVKNALDEKDLIIFGDDSFSSSFCYVSDCIDAVIKIMETDTTGPFNIGSDVDIKLVDLAKKVISLIGSNSKISYNKEKLFMTPLCLPDITKMRNELGWMPIVNLNQGLQKSIDDLRASKGLKGVMAVSRD